MSKVFVFAQAFSFYPVGSGLSNMPTAMYVYKNELYVGGSFYYAGGLNVNCIAKWNGSTWKKISGGSFMYLVHSFAQHNNLLYVGGSFDKVYDSIGVPVPNTKKLAVWDGTNWFSMGLPGATNTDDVKSMASYKSNLYVGGQISGYVSRWDGTWHPVVTQLIDYFGTPRVEALAVFNNELYVGGCFGKINGVPARNIARWNGTQWDSVGTGVNGCITSLFADTVNNLLYVGGGISEAGGNNLLSVAIWDGTNWLPIDSSTNCSASAFARYNNKVFVGGSGCNPYPYYEFSYWDGTTWHPVPQIKNMVSTLAMYKNELYIGGHFTGFTDTTMKYIVRMTMSNNIEEKKNSKYFLGDNVPNPFKSSTSIYYKIPINALKPIIKITDQSGKYIKEYPISPFAETLEISVNNWVEGVYYYTLIVNGENLKTKKMIFIK